METIDGAQVFRYREEVIVEVQGTDEQGAIDVVTYQLAYGEDDRTLMPKGPVDKEHTSIVKEILEKEGFQLSRGGD